MGPARDTGVRCRRAPVGRRGGRLGGRQARGAGGPGGRERRQRAVRHVVELGERGRRRRHRLQGIRGDAARRCHALGRDDPPLTSAVPDYAAGVPGVTVAGPVAGRASGAVRVAHTAAERLQGGRQRWRAGGGRCRAPEAPARRTGGGYAAGRYRHAGVQWYSTWGALCHPHRHHSPLHDALHPLLELPSA